ncbi:hypothetical protein DLAC_11530 [Tieghemostelium lacteum]|uniref:Fucosyltransferase n=1 Tax=Tieghemostelium lacteum TaxID=361077 RepID=A0A152A3I7_TIELA|nr:hypothetical protein DLAC_11530 [Tieghemostelium lacteum]|eukprot:KYR00808.1 hypothetical protein DLAC_11530 [Tieghemostelium lacteum]
MKITEIQPLLNTVETFDFYRDVMEPKRKYREQELSQNASSQIALAGWVTSNCEKTYSNRVDYITKLMEIIPINSYGKCLNNAKEQNIGITYNIKNPHKLETISHHKFYLSFENTNCKGYITEKPLHSYLAGTVPIVMAHPDNTFFLPRGSYIYVGDFDSATDLAKYLIYLDENEDEYKKYFKWRTDVKVLEQWKEHLTSIPTFPCGIGTVFKKWRSGRMQTVKVLHSSDFNTDCLPLDYHTI